VAVSLYCDLLPSKHFYWTTRHMMQYLGLIHFAVGYHYFFTSAAVRPQLAGAHPWFYAKLIACLIASVLVYRSPASEPLVYALFYLHAAENAVYHIYRSANYPVAPTAQRLSSDALWPLMAVLLFGRLSPRYATAIDSHVRLGCFVIVLTSFLFIRSLLPATSWRQGWRLVGQHHVLVTAFLIVAFFFPEGSIYYDYFIIWHYVIWFAYTWVQKPAGRARLVWSHVAFAVIYKILYLLVDAQVVLFHPLVLWILVGPVSFMAQTTAHILVAFAFRTYPAPAGAARPGPVRVAPAV